MPTQIAKIDGANVRKRKVNFAISKNGLPEEIRFFCLISAEENRIEEGTLRGMSHRIETNSRAWICIKMFLKDLAHIVGTVCASAEILSADTSPDFAFRTT
jgi:hypothetical protein